MQRITLAGVTAAMLAAVLLSGCGTQDDCDDDLTVIVLGNDGHYHYGSSTGKAVPDSKVPSAARTASGYRPTAAPSKVPVTKAPTATPPKIPVTKAPAATSKPKGR